MRATIFGIHALGWSEIRATCRCAAEKWTRAPLSHPGGEVRDGKQGLGGQRGLQGLSCSRSPAFSVLYFDKLDAKEHIAPTSSGPSCLVADWHRRVLKEMRAHRADLLRVLGRPIVPLHNNASESDIREYVKKRKISGSQRNSLMFQWPRLWKQPSKPPREQLKPRVESQAQPGKPPREDLKPRMESQTPVSGSVLCPPKAQRESSQSQAVLVRGDLWKNTAGTEGLAVQPNMGPAIDIAELMQRLRHNKPATRRSAAEVLGRIGSKASVAVPSLVVALADGVNEVRSAAKEALINIDQAWPKHEQITSVVVMLVEKLASSRSEECQAAAEVLVQIGVAAVAPLGQALQGPDDSEKSEIRQLWAARALGWIGPQAQSAVPALARTLSSEHRHLREAAAVALAKIGPAAKAAVPALTAALADWDESIRQAAARALGRIGAGAGGAAAALIALLPDRHEKVCTAAADALAEMGPSAIEAGPDRELAVKLLRRLESTTNADGCCPSLPDSDAEARFQRAKAEAEQEIADKVLGPLLELLADDDSRRRRSAAEALGQLGAAGKRAGPALEQALKDVNENVRKAAGIALRTIGGCRSAT